MIETIFNIWIVSILIVSSIGFSGAILASFYLAWIFIREIPKPKYRSIYDQE
mgnify:CR=1 FL=1